MDLTKYKEKIIEAINELEIKYTEIVLSQSYYLDTWENNLVLIIITEPLTTYPELKEKLEEKGIPVLYEGPIKLPFGGQGDKYIIIHPTKKQYEVI